MQLWLCTTSSLLTYVQALTASHFNPGQCNLLFIFGGIGGQVLPPLVRESNEESV